RIAIVLPLSTLGRGARASADLLQAPGLDRAGRNAVRSGPKPSGNAAECDPSERDRSADGGNDAPGCEQGDQKSACVPQVVQPGLPAVHWISFIEGHDERVEQVDAE